MIFSLLVLISCRNNTDKKNTHPTCKTLELVMFNKNQVQVDSFLLPKLICSWSSVKTDSPCCKRDLILSDVDKNYKTTLSTTYSSGCEIDLFADGIVDLFHFHKIIELKFFNTDFLNKNSELLKSVNNNLPAFKTENKGTLAWRLKPITDGNSVFLIFSNVESKYIEQIKFKLDSINRLK